MGSELVIVRWCDRCKARGDDVAEHRVRVDELDRVLDLCASCLDGFLRAIVDHLGDLANMGEPAPKAKAKAPRTTPAAAPSAVPSTSSSRVPCPLCPMTSASTNGLKQHVRIRHGLTWVQFRELHPEQDRLVA